MYINFQQNRANRSVSVNQLQSMKLPVIPKSLGQTFRHNQLEF